MCYLHFKRPRLESLCDLVYRNSPDLLIEGLTHAQRIPELFSQ